MRTITEDTAWTSMIPANTVNTVGTIVSATFVSTNAGESNLFLLQVGTVTAGSVTQIDVLSGTAATPGASTAVVGSLVITAGTAGLYGIEVRSNQMPGTAGFIGVRYVVPTGGSVQAGVVLERSNLRNMPPTNGLNGSALVLA